MARYLTQKDIGSMSPCFIIFTDGVVTPLPGVGPDSDMDGHDLSELTHREEAERDSFVKTFNNNFAQYADEFIHNGIKWIRVHRNYTDVSWEYDDGKEIIDPNSLTGDERTMFINSMKEIFGESYTIGGSSHSNIIMDDTDECSLDW